MINSRQELEQALIESIGIQVFYRRTTTKQVVSFPYIVYLDVGSDNFVADNVVFKNIMNYQVILHNDERDEELEKKIMNFFNDNMIVYEISDIDWDEDLSMWITSFTFQLVY